MINLIYKKFQKLDVHTLEVVKKSSSSLIVKTLGIISAFVISIILGRTIGPEGLGVIGLCNQIIGIILILSMLGMNNVVLKEISIACDSKNFKEVRNVIYTAIYVNIPAALLLSLMFICFSKWLSESLFEKPEFFIPFIILVLVVVPQTYSRIYAAGLNGLGKVWQSNLVNDCLSSVIVALGLLAMFLNGNSITLINVSLLYAVSRILVFATIKWYWSRIFKFKSKPNFVGRRMIKVALPLLVVSSTSLIASSADSIMLGWLSSVYEVGLYGVASSLGLMTNIFLAISISALAPKIAYLHASKRTKELELVIQKITQILFFLGLLTFIGFSLLGEFILNFWGNEFKQSYWILFIISLGQFFNIGTGSTGVYLMLTGHEKIIGKITLLSALLNLILNYVLIPIYGALGAAIATCSTVIVENIIKVIVVKKIDNILTLPFFISSLIK
mgnify:FL=1